MTTTDTQPPRRRAPGMSPDDRREMIVRAALPLLATHGAAVTTAQVARAAGIGEATVFRAFADKDALLDACVAEALRPDTALAALSAIPLDQPLAGRLTDAATALLAHLDRMGAVLAAAHAAGRPGRARRDVPPAGDRASRRDESAATVRAAVAALFAPEQDRLRLPADRLAALFLAVLLPGRGPLPADRPAPAELVDLFLHGALAGAGEGEKPTVTLNHTIVPARDHQAAARFFAEVMGLPVLPPAGRHGHFVPVRVNDQLTLDFLTVAAPEGHHLAFDVDPETFDAILARLRAGGVPYGSEPGSPDNGRIDHPLCARGLFFRDDSGNLYEVMSPA